MLYRKIHNTNLEISPLGLGTWAFGSDKWWGHQDDKKSQQVLDTAIEKGINLIDTAPAYGRGHSEEVIGDFLKKAGAREKVILATKLGLSWKDRLVFHNLKPKRMYQEIEESLNRLKTNHIDIYQVHWPDPDAPISETADVMKEFYDKGLIKAIGLSNFSLEQTQEFLKHSPLHVLQLRYNMFNREIGVRPGKNEMGTHPKKRDVSLFFPGLTPISVLAYEPLNCGVLTGKFFFENIPIPKDICRSRHKDLKEPFFTINKQILSQIKTIAQKYNKTLTQLVLNWTMNQQGITCCLTGARNTTQFQENLGSIDWKIEESDMEKIDTLLEKRQGFIADASAS